MTISHVQLFSIPVSDQDRSLAFYRDTLGFTVVSDTMMGPDMRWVMMGAARGETAITLVTWFPSMPAGSLKGTVLETDDLEGDVVSLRSNGLELGEIEDQPWGRFVTFDDPDGNGLILQASRA